MEHNTIRNSIKNGRTALGIEFGSTRIKALLIDEDHVPVASGRYEWENRYENGLWTYHLEDMWFSLQDSYRQLCRDLLEKFDTSLLTVGAIGFSGMMHGYLPFDQDGAQLAPFQTWRNTVTAQAAEQHFISQNPRWNSS